MPEGDNPQLGIEITANNAGAEAPLKQTTQSVAQLGAAADAAGSQVTALGGHGSSAFGKLVQGGRAAHGAMLGLNTSMQGGAASAVGLSRALNDVFILVTAAGASAGPWALLALGVGVVLGVMRGLTGHSKSAAAALKEVDKAAEDAAKANVKLGAAWETERIKAFNEALKESQIVMEGTIAKMKVLIATKVALDHELAKQGDIRADLGAAKQEQDTQAGIDEINASNLSPQEKAIRIAKLTAKGIAAKQAAAHTKSRNAAGTLSGDAQAAIEDLSLDEMASQEKLSNANEAVRRNKLETDDLVKQREKLTAQLQLRELEKKAQEELYYQEHRPLVDETQVEEAAADEQKARHALGVLNTQTQGLPSADQLVAQLSQLNGALEKLTGAAPGLRDSARQADETNASAYDVAEAKKAELRQVAGAKTSTLDLQSQLQDAAVNPSIVAQLSSVLRNITDDQDKMRNLTGAAFDAAQIQTNQQVDLLQQLLAIYKINSAQWKKIQQQLNAARSYAGPGG